MLDGPEGGWAFLQKQNKKIAPPPHARRAPRCNKVKQHGYPVRNLGRVPQDPVTWTACRVTRCVTAGVFPRNLLPRAKHVFCGEFPWQYPNKP